MNEGVAIFDRDKAIHGITKFHDVFHIFSHALVINNEVGGCSGHNGKSLSLGAIIRTFVGVFDFSIVDVVSPSDIPTKAFELYFNFSSVNDTYKDFLQENDIER